MQPMTDSSTEDDDEEKDGEEDEVEEEDYRLSIDELHLPQSVP